MEEEMLQSYNANRLPTSSGIHLKNGDVQPSKAGFCHTFCTFTESQCKILL